MLLITGNINNFFLKKSDHPINITGRSSTINIIDIVIIPNTCSTPLVLDGGSGQHEDI